MRVLILLVAVAGLSRGLLGLRRELAADEPPKAQTFEKLEDAQKAYDELVAKHIDLMKECGKMPPPTPKPEPVTVDPEEEAKEKEEDSKPITEPIGEPSKKEGKPIYRPPQSESGKPSSDEGWDYKKGGDDWPNKFHQCGWDQQSPIDFGKFVDIPGQTKSLLWFDYYLDEKVADDSELELRNAGHGIFADLKEHPVDFGFVKLVKDEYKVTDISFHTPAEHTIEGHRYPMEIQVYHQNKKNGKILAVSVLLKEGDSNEFLKAIEEGAGGMPVWTVANAAGKAKVSGKHKNAFDLEHLLPMGETHPGGDLTFYNYPGSLPYPPCTQGIDWWVLANPLTATKAELEKIALAIKESESSAEGNTRKAQPKNKRDITVGHTGFQHHGTGHRIPGVKKLGQTRGYTSQDHPWHKTPIWKDAVEKDAWKGKDKAVVGGGF